METKTISYPQLLTLSNSELCKEIKSLISSVIEQSTKHDWLINGSINLTDDELSKLISLKRDASTNSYKDFIYAFYRAKMKMTKRSFNSFLSKLSTVNKIKINTGIKEKAIQEKRKKWLELRAAAELARLDYRQEKGDFYKSRL